MTLDEAIRHCQEVADVCEFEASKYDTTDPYENSVAGREGECANEHRQLAEWLKELKHLRNLVSFAEYHNVSIKRAKEELLRHEVTS